MPEKEISFFVTLIQQYGIVTVAFSVLIVAISISVPIMLTWIKDSMKRKEDKKVLNVLNEKLLSVLNELSGEIKMLARQYSDSISMPQVEEIIENFLKHHSWALFDFVREIIEKNDIKNERPSIETKLKMHVYLTFKAIDNALAKFKYKAKGLNEFIDRCAWETQINDTVINTIYDDKVNAHKKIMNVRTYIKTEFGNIHFLIMQDVSKY
jgi:hypothetical protein